MGQSNKEEEMANVTRAKFRVNSITLNAYPTVDADGKTIMSVFPSIKMNPVTPPFIDGKMDPDHENAKFWTASPSGELTMQINNPLGAEVFEAGREYYIDFTPAD